MIRFFAHSIQFQRPRLPRCRFNREGDLLVTCGKDSIVNLWWADDGSRAGTFNGHNGAVWTLDLSCAWVFVSLEDSPVDPLLLRSYSKRTLHLLRPCPPLKRRR
jgi:WD40 repeat protein